MNFSPRKCPRCGSSHLQRSRRRSLIDGIFSVMGGQLRRCQDCHARRCWFGAASLPLAKSGAPEGVRAGAFVLFTGFVGCVALVWWTIARFAKG